MAAPETLLWENVLWEKIGTLPIADCNGCGLPSEPVTIYRTEGLDRAKWCEGCVEIVEADQNV